MTSQSSIDLVREATRGLIKLRKLLDPVPRKRDRACNLVTDTVVTLGELARRFSLRDHGFVENRVNTQDDENEHDHDAAEGTDQIEYVPLSELLSAPADESEEEVADTLLMSVRQYRRHHYRQFLDYLLCGSAEVNDVERKLLALGQAAEFRPMTPAELSRMAKDIIAESRRVSPQSLEAFGGGTVPGQVDVARKIKPGGERRATTCAREKRRVEKPLQKSGAKGFKLLGGTKSIAHRKACREAQQGNTNRADNHEKKKNIN